MAEPKSRYPQAAWPDLSDEALDIDGLVVCQGCGAVRGMSWLGKPHACWRNEDGTYEEGGTFQ